MSLRLVSAIIENVPGGIRTPNLLIRSQKLYPVELQAPSGGTNYESQYVRQIELVQFLVEGDA